MQYTNIIYLLYIIIYIIYIDILVWDHVGGGLSSKLFLLLFSVHHIKILAYETNFQRIKKVIVLICFFKIKH